MDYVKALKSLRTLIDVAAEQDDVDLIYKLLRQMRRIVNNTVPVPYKPPARKTATPRKKRPVQKRAPLRLVK